MKQPRDRHDYWKGIWKQCKHQPTGYGLTFIWELLTRIGVEFMSYENQAVADVTRLDTHWNRTALKVTYDDGSSIVGRENSCMNLESINERIILVKQPLGSGKSYQARKLSYNRIC